MIHELCARKGCEQPVDVFDASYVDGIPYHAWCTPSYAAYGHGREFLDPFYDRDEDAVMESRRKDIIEDMVDPDSIEVCDTCGCGLGHRKDCDSLPVPRSRALVRYAGPENPNRMSTRVGRAMDRFFVDFVHLDTKEAQA